MTTPTPIDEDALRDVLRAKIADCGSAGRWAGNAGVHLSEVSLFMSGKRPPGNKTVWALGYRRVASVHYIPA